MSRTNRYAHADKANVPVDRSLYTPTVENLDAHERMTLSVSTELLHSATYGYTFSGHWRQPVLPYSKYSAQSRSPLCYLLECMHSHRKLRVLSFIWEWFPCKQHTGTPLSIMVRQKCC
eukprot:6172061-Pleurochrysis_carterae.AAC.2